MPLEMFCRHCPRFFTVSDFFLIFGTARVKCPTCKTKDVVSMKEVKP